MTSPGQISATRAHFDTPHQVFGDHRAGVVEPAQAAPVIIEDGVFIGSRCIVVEVPHRETDQASLSF